MYEKMYAEKVANLATQYERGLVRAAEYAERVASLAQAEADRISRIPKPWRLTVLNTSQPVEYHLFHTFGEAERKMMSIQGAWGVAKGKSHTPETGVIHFGVDLDCDAAIFIIEKIKV